MKYILLFISIIFSTLVFSCTCRPIPNVKASYKAHDIIIAAKVIEIMEPKTDTIISNDGETSYVQNMFGRTIKLELISIYKGKRLSKYVIISPEESNCEYHFKKDGEYLIYAWSSDGRIKTNICTRTSPLKDNEDLLFLKHKYKKRFANKGYT